MVNESSKKLGIAATIAIRYSAVRLQGHRKGGGGSESQIIDYQTQQHRLFPLLACSYSFNFTGGALLSRLKKMEAGIGKITKVEMQDLHCSASALKVLASTITADGIEDCRKCEFVRCRVRKSSSANRVVGASAKVHTTTIVHSRLTRTSANVVLFLRL